MAVERNVESSVAVSSEEGLHAELTSQVLR
jgi:hypothetical protein